MPPPREPFNKQEINAMRTTLRTTKLFCPALAIAVSALSGSGLAQTATVPQFKQQVTTWAVDWAQLMKQYQQDLAAAKADLEQLKKLPPSKETDAKIDEAKNKIAKIQASMGDSGDTLGSKVSKLTVQPADKNDGPKLPDFVKKIIADKGVPLSKNVSIRPDATWNQKTNSVGSVSLIVQIKF
jgi:hypothetical protein